MSDEPKTLHINLLGGNWDIEGDATTLGQAETRQEAVELAKEFAPARGASCIAVHSSDGQVEQMISVKVTDSKEITPEKLLA
jgi:hypothetical protein